MKHFFKELFDYSHQCNAALIDAYHQHADKLSDRLVQLLNHIFNAHHIWNSRIIAVPAGFTTWGIHEPGQYAAIEKNNYETSIRVVETFDLDAAVQYTNTKGQAFNDKVSDILFQIINHSTYHRGQIAMEFRQNNIEPLLTEYIVYKWQANK